MPVTSEMSRTAAPVPAISLDVPPVDTRSTPSPASALAKSAIPVLSKTLRRARLMGTMALDMGAPSRLKGGPGERQLSFAFPDGGPSLLASRANAGLIAETADVGKVFGKGTGSVLFEGKDP